jgi:hypothetical protein
MNIRSVTVLHERVSLSLYRFPSGLIMSGIRS